MASHLGSIANESVPNFSETLRSDFLIFDDFLKLTLVKFCMIEN